MRKVVAFLVWLFSFWTWKGFFLRWLGSPRAQRESESLDRQPSLEKQLESDFTRFLRSLPEDGRSCRRLRFDGDTEVRMVFHDRSEYTFFHGADTQAGYSEFLEAAAASNLLFTERVEISLTGTESCEHMEALAQALCQSGQHFRSLKFWCSGGSELRFAQCFSNVLLTQDAIEELNLNISGGENVIAELVSSILTLPLLKSFSMQASQLDGQAMEQLVKPFKDPHSLLEEFRFPSIDSDVQVEQISGLLTTNPSLKTLAFGVESLWTKKAFTRGFTSVAAALCSNQSLLSLSCGISTSVDVKVLLDPLIPLNNSLQGNSTLTHLGLRGSVGGKEGMEALVAMICTNTSLLELSLTDLREIHFEDAEGVEYVLAILEALKTNTSLTRVELWGCAAVGGDKVLGAMMDMLLVNHNIRDIRLEFTGLWRSGDAEYVYSALAKRRNVKMCE